MIPPYIFIGHFCYAKGGCGKEIMLQRYHLSVAHVNYVRTDVQRISAQIHISREAPLKH